MIQTSLLEIICKATTGQKIRMLRTLRGFTQEQLAAEAGIDPMTVYFWEKGKRNPEPKYLRDTAKALGVKEEDLL